jgi:hypothetical protein
MSSDLGICWTPSPTQRESLGLLENQTMPSLRDVVHDESLCTFTIQQHLEIPSAPSWEAYGQGNGYGTEKAVHHVQYHTLRVTLLQPTRRAAVLGQSYSLRPHRSHISRQKSLKKKNTKQTGHIKSDMRHFQLIHLSVGVY